LTRSEIDQFIGAVLPERLDREAIKRLGQRTASNERVGEVEGHALIRARSFGLRFATNVASLSAFIASFSATAMWA
jgi:hypothetical protein